MRSIAKQFSYVQLATAVLGIIIVCVLALTMYQFRLHERKQAQLETLQRGIFELTILSYDYLTNRSKRAETQWQIKYKEVADVARHVGDGVVTDPSNARLYAEVKVNLKRFGLRFDDIRKADYSRGPADFKREQQVSTALLYLAQQLGSHIRQLRLAAARDSSASYTTYASLLSLTVVLAVVFVITLLLHLKRRTQESISQLSAGIGRLARGGLFKSNLPEGATDEFSQLMREFHRVSEVLSERYQKLITKLERERQKAEEMSDAKSKFLANISHEIRTPLSIIDGYAAIAADVNETTRKENLAKVRWNVQYVLALINEILDLSKVESGKMELQPSTFDILELAPVIASLQMRAEGKGLRFSVYVSGALPSRFTCDKVKLEQILMNIVGNAIKFTEVGSVALKIEYQADQFIFTITDTGIGIPEDKQAKLFTMFYQAQSTLSEKTQGTGLGLVLSKKLAQLMGGDVHLVTSSPGEGSQFVARIHVDDPQFLTAISVEDLYGCTLDDREIDIGEAPLAGVRVLLAEDNPDLQELTRRRIASLGAEVHTVSDGVEAVKEVVRSSYDLVLLDIQMPKMDGYAAVKRMRSLGVVLPIIACSARVMKQERAIGAVAGFDDYLEKPIELRQLVRLCKERGLTGAALDPQSQITPDVSEGMEDLTLAMTAKLPEYRRRLLRLARQGARDDLKITLHELKGVLACYGFTQSAAKCAALEVECETTVPEFSHLAEELIGIYRTYHSPSI